MIKRMDALQTQTVKSTTAPQPDYIPGLIAVVGCDGTGKSTLTNDLVKSLQQHWQTERRYLGLLSGEDGDKIKRLPLVGVWLERRLAAKSSKTQSMKTKSPALWAAVIMYCFSLRRMANLRKVQRLAQSGVLAGTATGGQILENPKHENQISGAMGGGDYVLLLAAKNGESAQGSATGAKWRSGGQRSLPAG